MTQTSDFSAWASAPPSWITSPGNDLNGAVISSRVRLARNLLGFPFPHNATVTIQKKSIDKTLEAIQTSKILKKSVAFQLNKLSALERAFLMERQLLSHDLASKQGENGLVVSSGEAVSLMINEEDHIRAACFKPGLGLFDAWETMSELDDELASQLPFSYSREFGYITACPTNLGTGLRASCLLHLPALVLTGKIQSVVSELTHQGLTARGFYGEGTDALGDLFQVSNQRTLGQSEKDIIKEVQGVIEEICALEKKETQTLLASTHRARIEDLIFRSVGTLQQARLLNLAEGMKHLSHIRLGAKLKLDVPASLERMTSLFFLNQPAHLQMSNPNPSGRGTDEQLRAEFLSVAFKKN